MRLLVVGGRHQGVEAVYLAKKAGFRVRVVDRSRPVPAMALGDEFLQLDVTAPGALALAADGVDLILPALENLEALRTLGVTPAHRKSFAPVKNLLAIDAAE